MINQRFRLPLLTAGLLFAVGPAFAVDAAGPQPYTAADPVYAPMSKEPVIAAPAPDRISLGNDSDIKGSAAGPQPYTAVDPMYPKTAPKP